MLLSTSCRLCGTDALRAAFTLDHAPQNIQRLPTASAMPSDIPVTLRVFQCAECHFVQLTEQLETDYYDDYLMTTSHSPQMRRYQREQALRFVSDLGLRGKRILEVGCGDGNYLGYLAEAGAKPVGLEPSEAGRQLATRRGFDVLSGYVGRDTTIPGSPYDGFVARQVLEHVGDINGFLQGAANSLLSGAPVLIEVPRLEQALEHNRFYDFFADHLNYFSRNTLAHALERNGFRVSDISDGMSSEYHVAVGLKTTPPEFQGLRNTTDSAVTSFRTLVNERRLRGKRVAVWGAGGKGATILAVSRATDLEYVIDSDVRKQGHFTPVTHVLIVPPETLIRDPVDVVVLTALAYRDEILHQLRDTLRFSGEIVVFDQDIT